eukprot:9447266-Pyramimonas_sp.AAC.1
MWEDSIGIVIAEGLGRSSSAEGAIRTRQHNANAMPNQCQGDPNSMPMQCQRGVSFVVDSKRNPTCGGFRWECFRGGLQYECFMWVAFKRIPSCG